MLRFAILKEIETEDSIGNKSLIVLEYNEEQILSRLQSRIRENLVKKESFFKHSFNKNTINYAFTSAFRDLVNEFKERTIILK